MKNKGTLLRVREALATQIDLSERRKDFGEFYLEAKSALSALDEFMGAVDFEKLENALLYFSNQKEMEKQDGKLDYINFDDRLETVKQAAAHMLDGVKTEKGKQ